MTPLLILIGADKGGVGKTTVTRTVLDYLTAQGRNWRAFDTESPKGVLKQFHPNNTTVVDLTRSDDQMKVFDTLSNASVTVIDVRAGLLSPTLKMLGEIGLLDLVKNDQIRVAIFHVLGPSVASLQEIEATGKIIGGSLHFLVKNHINDTQFFEWDKTTYDAAFANARNGLIEIPKLTELATEHVERNQVTFQQFINNETGEGRPANYSMVLRGYTRTWLKQVFEQYDKIKLPDIVSVGLVDQVQAK